MRTKITPMTCREAATKFGKLFGRTCLLASWILMCSLAGARSMAKSSASTKADSSTARAMSVLRVNCLTCHNDEKKKGGLRLTSRENALKGSDNGQALGRRKADKSLLAKAIRPDPEPHMPPKKQLTKKNIATSSNCIEAAAKLEAKG